MKDFVFHIPTEIYFGKNAQAHVGELCGKYGSRVLILYGSPRIEHNGLLDEIEDQLKIHGVTCIRCGGVCENTSLHFVRAAIKKARENQIQMLLAVGGGSVVDTAKAVSIGICAKQDIWDIYEGKAVPEYAVPVGVILTAAATASEANPVSVLMNDDNGHKIAFRYPLLYPSFALLNPELTFTVPAIQTSIGSIDIFAHAFERYFHKEQKSILRDKLCTAIMQTVIEVLPYVLKHPKDYEGRSQLMWAATMAHSDMIGTEGVYACHQMSHVLTQEYHLSHGEALAILMPAWCKYMLPKHCCEFATFATDVWQVKNIGQGDEKIAEEGLFRFQKFISDCGLAVTLREAGIQNMDCKKLVKLLFDNKSFIGEAFEPVDAGAAGVIFEMAR